MTLSMTFILVDDFFSCIECFDPCVVHVAATGLCFTVVLIYVLNMAQVLLSGWN